MPLWVFSFLLLGCFASADSLEPYTHTNAEQLYQGTFIRGGRGWARLKEGLTATVPAGTLAGSMPETLNGCRLSQAVQGRLVTINSETVAIALPAGTCATTFNQDVAEPNIVFVKRGDLKAPTLLTPTEAGTTFRGCPACTAAKEMKIGVPAGEEEARSTDPLKSEEEVERYIACYPTAHQKDYNQYYKKLYELASDTFQVLYLPRQAGKTTARAPLPPEVKPVLGVSDFQAGDSDAPVQVPFWIRTDARTLKCLGLRESQWDRSRASATQAWGLGQQTTTNITDIKKLLAAKDGWAKPLWDKYFASARKRFSATEWHWLTHDSKGHHCAEETLHSKSDVWCPIHSIAAKVIYQTYIEIEMRRKSKLNKSEAELHGRGDLSPEQRGQQEIVKATSYNAGLGTAIDTVQTSDNPADWQRIMSAKNARSRRSKELTNYQRYMNNCLKSGNWKPVDDTIAERDCNRVQTSR